MRRKYVSCLGNGCYADDDDLDGEYSRLDNASLGDGENVSMVDRQSGGERTENDYFRSPDSYQWDHADNDQGQEPTQIDQGANTYTGVQIETKKDKKKMAKKTAWKRIRHFLRVSLKWMRRGFVTASPAMTSQIIMNPAVVMTTTMSRQVHGKSMVYL